MNSNPGTFVVGHSNSSSWTVPRRRGLQRCRWSWSAPPSAGRRWVRDLRAKCRRSHGRGDLSRTLASSLGSSLECKCPAASLACAVRLGLYKDDRNPKIQSLQKKVTHALEMYQKRLPCTCVVLLCDLRPAHQTQVLVVGRLPWWCGDDINHENRGKRGAMILFMITLILWEVLSSLSAKSLNSIFIVSIGTLLIQLFCDIE